MLPMLICCLVHARSRDPGAEGMLPDLVSRGKKGIEVMLVEKGDLIFFSTPIRTVDRMFL